MGDDPLLGPSLIVLRGQALQELGMAEAMLKLFERARNKVRGRLAFELSYHLAEAYFAAEQREKAAPLYEKLATSRDWTRRTQCRLRLAEMALRNDKYTDCLKWCREALQEREGLDIGAVLKLMAKAYEQTGARDKAIRCLSGELPE